MERGRAEVLIYPQALVVLGLNQITDRQSYQVEDETPNTAFECGQKSEHCLGTYEISTDGHGKYRGCVMAIKWKF